MRHVISALVMNEPGVLAQVANLFSARGFNIDSLVVGRTENPELSRMTVVLDADDNTLEQVRKQLAKLVPVVKVRDFTGTKYVERDLALVTVGVSAGGRSEVIEIVNLFRGKVVDVARNSLVVELSGPEEKVEAMIELLAPYGIKELARTGVIAMSRGTQNAKDEAAEKAAPAGGKRKRSISAPQRRSASAELMHHGRAYLLPSLNSARKRLGRGVALPPSTVPAACPNQ